MSRSGTITLTLAEYDALVERKEELEDILAAREADSGTRVPHEVAVSIIRGQYPVAAFRSYHGMTLCELAEKTGIAASYLSEIERGLKPGSASALSRIAAALGTSVDALISDV